MASWMKHVLGLLLPTAVAVGLMASAPKQDAPDWIISVSALCVVVAIVYCYVVFSRWMTARQNHSKVALSLFVGGSAYPSGETRLAGIGGNALMTTLRSALERALWSG
jgi:FtsH-binding integral membrane protein